MSRTRGGARMEGLMEQRSGPGRAVLGRALYAVTRAVAEAPTLAEAIEAMLREVCHRLGWALGAFWLLDASAQALRCEGVWSEMPSRFPAFESDTLSRTFHPRQGLPGRVWHERAACWIEDLNAAPDFPRRAVAAPEGIQAALAVPVMASGEMLGVLELFATEARAREPEHEESLVVVGAQIGQLIQRKQAVEALRQSEARLRFLTRASTVLSASLDYEETLRHVVTLAVPEYADWSVVSLDTGGTLSCVAVAARTPQIERTVRAEFETCLCDPASPPGRAFRSGEAVTRRVDEMPGCRIHRMSGGSLLSAPLVARGQWLGTLTLGREGAAPYGPEETALALDIASRAALAIDNARLFREAEEARSQLAERLAHEDELLQTLVRSFLGTPPHVPELDVATLYQPAESADFVGGDCYDFFRLDAGRLAIMVGDVSGKGLRAGVYLAMVRYLLHACMTDEREPARILARLNDLLCREMEDVEMFVTMAFLVLDSERGELTYANAAHPAPVLLTPEGGARQLSATGGILGCMPDMTFEQAVVPWPFGSTLALFTDGVTEAGGVPAPEGDGGVGALLVAHRGETAGALAAGILAHALAQCGDDRPDDIAIVVVRRLLAGEGKKGGASIT